MICIVLPMKGGHPEGHGRKAVTAVLELAELVEHCAVSVLGAQLDDMPGLVAMHSDFQKIRELTSRPGFAEKSVSAGAGKAEKLLESLVLQEAQDAEAALAEVGRLVCELQKFVDSAGTLVLQLEVPGAPAGTPTSAERSSNPVSAPPAAAKHAIEQEQVITEDDAAMAMEFVGEAITHLDTAEASLLKLADEPDNLDEVNAVFRAFHTIKGVAGFLNLRQVCALAHVAETLLDLARKGLVQLSGQRLDVVLEALDLMKRLIASVELAAKNNQAPAVQDGVPDMVRRLEAAARGTGPGVDTRAARPLIPDPSVASASASPPPHEESASAATETTVKVATDRLDALINTVGELVISQAMVSQDLAGTAVAGNQRLTRNLSHLGKITRSLQDLSMAMRMVPIQSVFQKMARLVRDVAKKAGKEVNLVQQGGETELDRNVVEAIGDPLVHMIRNAADHGIEYAEDRIKAGKPRAGRILLKACHQGGNVVIEISDDGKGLNKARIVQKAIAAGIVTQGQVLTDPEIFRLIFHPGLSTAEKVTDISGRGVGMDVVKKNVESLRGRIEIASTEGLGSTFTIRLPLTLAVIDGLVVKVGSARYIIPITSIEQSIRPAAEQLSTVQGRGEIVVVRGKLLPLVRLHKLFGVTPSTEDPTKALVVIVQDGNNRYCLLVDELLGQQQVVIKSLGEGLGRVPEISGCAILGDGNASLILDVAGVIHSTLGNV